MQRVGENKKIVHALRSNASITLNIPWWMWKITQNNEYKSENIVNPAVVHTFFSQKLLLLSSELSNLILESDSITMTIIDICWNKKHKLPWEWIVFFIQMNNIQMLVIRKQQRNIRNNAVSSEYCEAMELFVIND